MKQYAKAIGADCPFFISNKPAFVTGIGNKIEQLNFSLDNYKIVLKKPNINLNTAKIFSLISPCEDVINLKETIKLPINKWKNTIVNDFETVIFERYPEIKEIKENFYKKGALYASMTGSGSTVFAIFDK